MWYLLMSSGSASTTMVLFLIECDNPMAFQQHNEPFGHSHYSSVSWPWTHQQILDETSVEGSSRVPVCQHVAALTIISSLSETSVGCLEPYPAATNHLWTAETEWRRPIRMMSHTLIPDTERNTPIVMIRKKAQSVWYDHLQFMPV